MSDSSAVLHCKNLFKSYSEGPKDIEVIRDISLAIQPGEKLAIVGASGSGKSTLLNLLGGLDRATKGEVWIRQQKLSQLNEKERGNIRNQHIGFVYQFHHLLAEFNAIENVAMPLLIRGIKKKLAYEKAKQLLKQVGLSARVQHKPSELSGGERQRVAIARALIAQPACVLMDEPTGNLDSHTAQDIQELMWNLNKDLGTSFIIVTHDIPLAESLDRVVHLEDGEITEAKG